MHFAQVWLVSKNYYPLDSKTIALEALFDYFCRTRVAANSTHIVRHMLFVEQIKALYKTISRVHLIPNMDYRHNVVTVEKLPDRFCMIKFTK